MIAQYHPGIGFISLQTAQLGGGRIVFGMSHIQLDVAHSEYNSSTSKLGSLQRDESNARMILGNHQFTYRSRLAQKKD